MIEAKELRIGNYVSYNDRTMEVHSFTTFNIVLSYGTAFHTEIKNISPIPITKDWLIKFGLELNVWFEDGSFMVTKDGDWGFELHVQNADWTKTIAFAYFLYVHDFQNLIYALTKTELEISGK